MASLHGADAARPRPARPAAASSRPSPSWAFAFRAGRPAVAADPPTPQRPPISMRAEGARFVAGGRTRFVRANVAIMHGAAAAIDGARSPDAIAADGMRVVRVWALGEHAAGSPDRARDYASA